MKKKIIAILIIIIVIVIGLFVFKKISIKNSNEIISTIDNKENDKAIIFQLEKDDIYKFSFTSASGDPLTFELMGNKWVFSKNTDLDIDQDAINMILDKLSTIRCTQELVDVNASDYGVDNPDITYVIYDAMDNATEINISKKYEKTDEYYFTLNNNYSVIYLNDKTITSVSDFDLEVLASK